MNTLYIDVRIDEDFNLDPRMVFDSVRIKHTEIDKYLPLLRGKKVIVICQAGLKLSQGTAGILNAHGIDATHLVGGFIGIEDKDGMEEAPTYEYVAAAEGTDVDTDKLVAYVDEDQVDLVTEKFGW